MFSNIITYFLLYQVFSHVLVLVFYDNILENIVGYISFRCKHEETLFNFVENGMDHHFTINFPDPEFATALLSFVCSRHMNKCKYLIFVKLKNISQWKRFLTNLLNIEGAPILRSTDIKQGLHHVNFFGGAM